jgi:hypothetical protein
LHEIYRYYEILGEEQYELHTRWLWRRLWKGIISLSKSTAILTAIMSNSASHFGGRNGFTGGQILSLGGNCPPRYIVKKGTAPRGKTLGWYYSVKHAKCKVLLLYN